MTRLLVISMYYAPDETGIAPYATQLCEHLASRGYEVTAVTGLPHYPDWRVSRRVAPRGAVDVRRRWHHVPGRPAAVGRAAYEGSFMLTGLSALALDRPAAVLAIVPALAGGVVARIAARRFGVPYGIVLQDLVAPGAAQAGVEGGRAVSKFVRAAEGWSVRGAEAVGIIAEGFRPYVESLGVAPGRIRRLRNWTHIDPPSHDREAAREAFGFPPDACVCLHAGNMGYKQGLANVIDAARIAASDPRLLFVLAGDGAQRPALQAAATRHALPNLRFLPVQPADRFAALLSAADVLLISQRASIADVALPSKLTSYLAAGRPVVAAVAPGTETAAEVRASGAGLVVAPEEPQALVDALRTLAFDAERRGQMGAAGRLYAQRVLSRDAALRGYEQFVASIVAAGRGRVHAPTVAVEELLQ